MSFRDSPGANIKVFNQVTDWSEDSVQALQDTYEKSPHQTICYKRGKTEFKVKL